MDLEKQNIVTTRKVLYGILVSVIFGAGLLMFLLWGLGVFGTAEDRQILKTWKEDKAKREKIIQTALADAEKARKEAEVIRKQNDELQAKLTERDKKRDSEIKQNDERRKEESEKIIQEYNADVERTNNMSDAERDQDICARLERLAKDNPTLAQFKCQ